MVKGERKVLRNINNSFNLDCSAHETKYVSGTLKSCQTEAINHVHVFQHDYLCAHLLGHVMSPHPVNAPMRAFKHLSFHDS